MAIHTSVLTSPWHRQRLWRCYPEVERPCHPNVFVSPGLWVYHGYQGSPRVLLYLGYPEMERPCHPCPLGVLPYQAVQYDFDLNTMSCTPQSAPAVAGRLWTRAGGGLGGLNLARWKPSRFLKYCQLVTMHNMVTLNLSVPPRRIHVVYLNLG